MMMDASEDSIMANYEISVAYWITFAGILEMYRHIEFRRAGTFLDENAVRRLYTEARYRWAITAHSEPTAWQDYGYPLRSQMTTPSQQVGTARTTRSQLCKLNIPNRFRKISSSVSFRHDRWLVYRWPSFFAPNRCWTLLHTIVGYKYCRSFGRCVRITLSPWITNGGH